MGGQRSDFGSLLWCFDCFISENFEEFTGKIMWMVWTVASSDCYPWRGIFKFGGNSSFLKQRVCLRIVWKILWRKAWQPTPVFLPGESRGQRSLAGSSLWDCKESDMTEWLTLLTTTVYYTRNLNVWFLILIILLFNLIFFSFLTFPKKNYY